VNRIEITVETDVSDETIDKTEIFCKKLLSALKTDGWEVSILFCDDIYIRQLNKQYRSIDAATDVLSFPQGEQYHEGETFYAGDIIVSLDSCRSQAEELGIPPNEELKRLLVHGILHLKGMVHDTDTSYDEMMGLQEKLLSRLSEDTLL
jgi:probable rRNA maturation factor